MTLHANLGECYCESLHCDHGDGPCRNQAVSKVLVYGELTKYCQTCIHSCVNFFLTNKRATSILELNLFSDQILELRRRHEQNEGSL